jgi:hypothetical protein
MDKKPVVMDNCFFIGSLCLISSLALLGVWLVNIISLFVIVFVFSDRVKKIESKWKNIDGEDEEDGRKNRV